MQLSVRANFKDVQAMLRQFPKEVRDAAVAALNKTALQTRTQMYKRIRERRMLTLSAADLKERLKIHRASYSRMTASVSIEGKNIPLNQFKYRFSKGSGVFADVVGGGLRGPVTEHGNKAFTNPALAGGKAIFVRTSSHRLPIEKVFGPSLPSAITAHGWDTGVLKVEMAEAWARNFTNQLEWRLARYVK